VTPAARAGRAKVGVGWGEAAVSCGQLAFASKEGRIGIVGAVGR